MIRIAGVLVLCLVALLFAVSIGHGVTGLGIVIAVGGLYLVVVFIATRARGVCPGCSAKSLECINYFRCNPPPNHSFFRCQACSEEYVGVNGQLGMTERRASPFNDSPGW